MGKKALVLSGGSIKGAFQAGAIQQVLEEGFEPDIIHGVSVGALNGGFMVNETGKRNNDFVWPDIGNELVNFWKGKVRRPSDLIKRKSKLTLGANIVTNRFKGIVSTSPLQNLVRSVAPLGLECYFC